MAGLTLETGWTELLPGLLLTGAGMSFMFGTMSAAVMRSVPLPLMTAASRMMADDDVFWMMGILFLISVPFLWLLGSGRQKKALG